MMRIDWLRDCVNLGRTLNFTEAAKLSSIAQPAFSKHIKSAENEVGTPLFHRTKREVSLTPAGAIFVESAKHILEEYDGAMQNIASLQKNTKRVLKIGYLQGLMARDLPRIQSRFSYEFPDIFVEYITYEFNEIIEALEEGEIDLAASFIPEALGKPKFSSVVFFEDECCVIVDPRNPLTEKKRIKPEDLREQTVTLPASDFFTSHNARIIDYLDARRNEITIEEQVRDINSLPILIQANDWIGISFGHLRDYHAGELQFMPLVGFDQKTTYGAIWKASRFDSPLKRWGEIAAEVNAQSHKNVATS